MSPKKGKSGKLPRVDRSRALPVRSDIGFWKVLAIGALVGVLVYGCDKVELSDLKAKPTEVVSTQ